MSSTFQFGVHLSWGLGLFLAAFVLANVGPAAAMACLGVVVMLGAYVSHTIAGFEQQAAEARAAEADQRELS